MAPFGERSDFFWIITLPYYVHRTVLKAAYGLWRIITPVPFKYQALIGYTEGQRQIRHPSWPMRAGESAQMSVHKGAIDQFTILTSVHVDLIM